MKNRKAFASSALFSALLFLVPGYGAQKEYRSVIDASSFETTLDLYEYLLDEKVFMEADEIDQELDCEYFSKCNFSDFPNNLGFMFAGGIVFGMSGLWIPFAAALGTGVLGHFMSRLVSKNATMDLEIGKVTGSGKVNPEIKITGIKAREAYYLIGLIRDRYRLQVMYQTQNVASPSASPGTVPIN